MTFRLQLLGGAALLAGDDGPLGGAVARRHPLALLTLLATARGRPVGREKLIALLWPEASASRARHSLSNALHVVRREVQAEAVITSGDEVRLDPARVVCDAAEFDAAMERKAFEEAIELYAGPFLDGFHLPDAERFEAWARDERNRYERAFEDALEELAEAAADRCDWREAARWWERRARHDPASSRAVMGLMTALVASGDRVEALRRSEAHAAHLDAEHGLAPDPAVAALADQIRGALPPLHPAFHPQAFDRSEEHAPKVAVLPFENLCGETDAYLVEGLVNDVITRLSREEGITVLSRTTALRFRDGVRSVREIARETGARYVVEGAVQRIDDRFRVNVQLIDAAGDRHLWAERFDRPAERVLEVQTEIAERIAGSLGERLRTRRRPAATRDRPVDDEANRLFQRARFHGNRRTRRDVERATELYRATIETDPGLARAWAGLVDAHFTAHGLGIARENARDLAREAAAKAISLGPDLADAHAAMALVRWWEGDFDSGKAAFERAIELDPGLVIAHHRFAILLAGLGRLEESLREILTALALDPLSPVLHYNVGIKYLYARDHDGAVRRFRSALEIEPRWGPAHSAIALARAYQGREEEALAALRQAMEGEPESGEVRLEAAWVLGTFGREAEARKALREGIDRDGSPVETGIAHLPLGEVDRALDWISSGDWAVFDRPRRWDPRLDPVRTHPRFLDLLGRPTPVTPV